MVVSQELGLLEREPSLWGVDVDHARRVLKVLAAAGLVPADIWNLTGIYPAILSMR